MKVLEGTACIKSMDKLLLLSRNLTLTPFCGEGRFWTAVIEVYPYYPKAFYL